MAVNTLSALVVAVWRHLASILAFVLPSQLVGISNRRLRRPTLPHFAPASPTNEKLDWADLPTIDLALASTAEGRKALVPLLRDALATHGFFYAVNHGWSEAETARVFDLARYTFDAVDEHTKRAFTGDTDLTGTYTGYKPRQFWAVNGGRDEIEHYNVRRDVRAQQHPQALAPFVDDLDAFARHNHLNVLYPILRLLALGLGLEHDEDALVRLHRFEDAGESSARFMAYHPKTDEQERDCRDVWLKGHTDVGSVTILWSQPITALQILVDDDKGNTKWKWVRHVPNALVVNSGDVLEHLSGGVYRPTVHRVVRPPADQRGFVRLGAFYFAMPSDDVRLVPVVPRSAAPTPPLVNKAEEAYYWRWAEDPTTAPTMKDWRTTRTRQYGRVDLNAAALSAGSTAAAAATTDSKVETENVNGVLVKHYN